MRACDRLSARDELLFDNILRQTGVLEFLTVTIRLSTNAQHYTGSGRQGQPRHHTDENRRGLLGHGSILTVTAYRIAHPLSAAANDPRTASARRRLHRRWMCRLDEKQGVADVRSMRERMQAHV